jgi:transcriptional regulator with XRE-family HTH domain
MANMSSRNIQKAPKRESVAVRLGKRIKELRTTKGFTQVEMSAASGLGQAYLSRVEAGSKRVSIDSLESIAIALGVSLSELLKGV